MGLHVARFLYRTLARPVYWWYERNLETKVRSKPLPKHLGIILDGNRRFARSFGLNTWMGHEFGAKKAHDVLEWCLDLGVPHVTIWVFSTENFDRDPQEVSYLLELFVREANQLAIDPRIKRHRVRVKIIGQRHKFPPSVLNALEELERSTREHDGMLLNIAIGYGGREEIVDAVQRLMQTASDEGRTIAELADNLSMADIDRFLYTAGIPDPDFVIRTSGEVRLSGFLLWQAAYSEYYFCDALWPDFRRIDFLRALRSYQGRERRYGH